VHHRDEVAPYEAGVQDDSLLLRHEGLYYVQLHCCRLV
jgi:hypothetical protein